jgi:hypothetical protein
MTDCYDKASKAGVSHALVGDLRMVWVCIVGSKKRNDKLVQDPYEMRVDGKQGCCRSRRLIYYEPIAKEAEASLGNVI